MSAQEPSSTYCKPSSGSYKTKSPKPENEENQMGVSIRQQKRDSQWYVHIRYAGQRVAEKCLDEEDAKLTREEILRAIRRGEFDIAALKKKRQSAPTEEKPAVVPPLTLKDYYEATIQ